jgi:molybdopterin-biosynthesis enzyme MoeA-like protein
MLTANVEADGLPEGIYGDALREVAEARPAVSIGSYPSFNNGRFRNQIVVRSKELDALAEAKSAVEAMLARLKGDAKPL